MSNAPATLTRVMDDAFERLARQEAHQPHVWGKPYRRLFGHNRRGKPDIREWWWMVRCTVCDAVASRRTLKQLRDEVTMR